MINGKWSTSTRRFALFISVFVVFAGVLAVASGNPATAQDATMATHRVVGAWRYANDLGEGIAFPSLGIFHADGTYMEVLPDGEILIGLWQPTGDRTADLTVFSNYVIEDKLAQGEGRFTVEVDEAGNAISTMGPFVGRFEDGSIDIAVEGPASGTRLAVLPVVPLADLVPGGTPVIPSDLTGEATPAA